MRLQIPPFQNFFVLTTSFLGLIVWTQVVPAQDTEGEWVTVSSDSPSVKWTQQELKKRYPEGKSWIASSVAQANGEYKNKNWIRSQGNVFYQNSVTTQWKVERNTGGVIEFECEVIDSSQTRILSNERFRMIDLKEDSPMLSLAILRSLQVLSANPTTPKIAAAIRLGQWGEIVDPGFERSLTASLAKLKAFGLDLTKYAETDFELKLNTILKGGAETQVAGHIVRIRVTGEPGLTEIKTIKGPLRASTQLTQLAGNLSPMLDMYVFPNADARMGEKFSIDLSRASDLMNFGPGMLARGLLTMEYGSDATYDTEGCRSANLEGGTAKFTGSSNGIKHTTSLTPKLGKNGKPGLLLFSKNDLLVRRMSAEWDVSTFSVTENHLLFGVEKGSKLEVSSRYEAQLGSIK